MTNYYAPYPPPQYPQAIPQPTSTVKRAALVGAVMGAAGATAGYLKQEETDSGMIGDVLAGAVTGGLATAGVVTVGEAFGMKPTLPSTAVMFLAGTALLYTLKK
ncbi:hypothetical protein [Candidatus Albibeggiatoa sp. nov. NOAA]|uniref:hypothetical protein n=1 Tax=Candidatus Albibeggiatoa sp. nov. NOAA TaxID=3162724 RepID=UPI0032F4D1CF|nr:hypothetical protein [Thiotrichaceae bacterium]